MRRALVTGATGLVGGALVRALLAAGVEVVVLERRPAPPGSVLAREKLRERCTVVPGDVLEPAALDAALTGCDAAFHLAARPTLQQARADPAATWAVNAGGTWSVLEAARRQGVHRVLTASTARAAASALASSPATAAAASRIAAAGPSDATALTDGHGAAGAAPSPYDASKACAEALALAAGACVLRLPNVYGPGDANRTRLVPSVIDAIRAGRAPQIGSDGSPERAFLHADDAAAALLAVVERPGGTFAAAPEQRVSVRTVVETLVAGTGLRPRYDGLPEPDGPPLGDATALRALGWRPRIELADGLAETLAWARGEHP